MNNCLQCNKEIKGLRTGAKFCSGACKTKYSRRAKKVIVDAKVKISKAITKAKAAQVPPDNAGIKLSDSGIRKIGRQYFDTLMGSNKEDSNLPTLREYDMLIVYLQGEGINQEQAIKLIKKANKILPDKKESAKKSSDTPPDGLSRIEKMKWLTEHKKNG